MRGLVRGLARDRVRGPALAAVALATAAVGGCAEAPATPAPSGVPGRAAGDPGFGHVHGLGRNAGDGLVYAATHYGVFVLEKGGPRRVADRYQDTMGFTVAGPDRFLGSGHPDLREPGPPHLGLVESTDRAQTWRSVALRGEVDFHALTTSGAAIYGWDSRSGAVLRSGDSGRTWQRGAVERLADLDADPADPMRVVGTAQRGLVESRDGGTTFAPAAAQPPALLFFADHVPPDGLAGVAGDGSVWVRDGARWARAGSLPGTPEAFTVADDGTFLAATADGVHRSDDRGATWALVARSAH